VLRQKQFYVSASEPAQFAESPKLARGLLALFSAMLPLVRFLNTPLQKSNDPEGMFERNRIW
jgi:hypothetical protein